MSHVRVLIHHFLGFILMLFLGHLSWIGLMAHPLVRRAFNLLFFFLVSLLLTFLSDLVPQAMIIGSLNIILSVLVWGPPHFSKNFAQMTLIKKHSESCTWLFTGPTNTWHSAIGSSFILFFQSKKKRSKMSQQIIIIMPLFTFVTYFHQITPQLSSLFFTIPFQLLSSHFKLHLTSFPVLKIFYKEIKYKSLCYCYQSKSNGDPQQKNPQQKVL